MPYKRDFLRSLLYDILSLDDDKDTLLRSDSLTIFRREVASSDH